MWILSCGSLASTMPSTCIPGFATQPSCWNVEGLLTSSTGDLMGKGSVVGPLHIDSDAHAWHI